MPFEPKLEIQVLKKRRMLSSFGTTNGIHRFQSYRESPELFSPFPLPTRQGTDFSVAGVCARARRASLSVSTLSNLLFINKNTDVASELQNIDLFTGSLESVDDEIIDEVEDFLQENNEIS